jgi:hypothetical protein
MFLVVFWRLRYKLSLRDLAEMLSGDITEGPSSDMKRSEAF